MFRQRRSRRRFTVRTLAVCILAVLAVPGIASAAWIDVSITGYGHVRKTEGHQNIDCWSPATTKTGAVGATCGGAETFGWGVRFEAEAPPGWQFDGWEDSCGGTGSCAFTTLLGTYGLKAKFRDVRAPTTTITDGPPRTQPVPISSARFRFGADEPGTRFECALDGSLFGACGDGHTVEELRTGEHRFLVRAIDPSGHVGPAAEWVWNVDVTGPVTRIDQVPDNPTRSTTATFRVGSENGAVIRCRVDEQDWEVCPGVFTKSGLADGGHRFAAYSTDALGNAGPQIVHDWRIDTVGPKVTIGDGPGDGATTDESTARFEFDADEQVTRYVCSLDNHEQQCTSPKAYDGLRPGQHVFGVRAVDEAGNVGPTSKRSWRVVPVDRDRDGISPPADCDDNNADVHPGANDIPDNAIDEDCVGGPAVNLDRDRDGFQRPQDCADNDARVHPGATDAPRNGVDEDCDGIDADFGKIASDIVHGESGKGRFTLVRRLAVVNSPAGARIEVTCRGRGCRFGRRTKTTPAAASRVSLVRMFRGTKLRARAVVEVSVKAPARYGKVLRLSMRQGKPPKVAWYRVDPVTGKRSPW